MNLKLTGSYNKYDMAFGRATIFVSVKSEISLVIRDIYAASKCIIHISINDSQRIRAELVEMHVKANSCVLTFELDVNKEDMLVISLHSHDRIVDIDMEYDTNDRSLERVSNASYASLMKLIKRMSAAMAMDSHDTLIEAINVSYGYRVALNQNMYRADADSLRRKLEEYAEENIPGFAVDINDDSYYIKRAKDGLCSLCGDKYVKIISGVSLCGKHHDELNKTGKTKFYNKYHLE